MSSREKAHCIREQACLDARGDHMPVCVTPGNEAKQYILSTPLVPAESLCLRGLEAVRESRSSNRMVDTFSSICFDLDRAIAIPNYIMDHSDTDNITKDNRQIKEDIFVNVARMMSRTPNLSTFSNAGEFATAAQMKRLGLFMPAFKARLDGKEVSVALTQTIHRNLVGYITELDSLVHRPVSLHLKKQISAHKAESEVMALFSRKGVVPWPALAREEASHARSQHNHDFYTLRGIRKQAYQVKTSASGSGYRGVTVIRHYDILKAMKRGPEEYRDRWEPKKTDPEYEWPSPYVYEQLLAGQTPDPLADLLREEVGLGRRMDSAKRNALELATVYVSASR